MKWNEELFWVGYLILDGECQAKSTDCRYLKINTEALRETKESDNRVAKGYKFKYLWNVEKGKIYQWR